MKTFNKKEYQKNYYLSNKDRIRRKSQDYYYIRRYNKTYEEIMQEKENMKPKFYIKHGVFVIQFE
jgi:hypothetical protein